MCESGFSNNLKTGDGHSIRVTIVTYTWTSPATLNEQPVTRSKYLIIQISFAVENRWRGYYLFFRSELSLSC